MTQTLEHVSVEYLMPGWEVAEIEDEFITMPEVAEPIDGNPAGKNLLSMHQLTADDIYAYIEEARAFADVIKDQRGQRASLVNGPRVRGVSLLPGWHMDVVMRQPSTRTGGSMAGAMAKLGGSAELISGMASSSEAKGESRADSDLALATQSDILAMRTKENYGPVFAAQAIARSRRLGKLEGNVPVINLGDGTVEHPTQALGDFYVMHRYLGDLAGRTIAIVGDHERYRAHHSEAIGAFALGMNVIAVESDAAPMPQSLVTLGGDRLQRTTDLDAAMREADVLSIGRNPDEYTGDDASEKERSLALKAAYEGWIVDDERLQQMKRQAIVLHPRPRRDELHPSVDGDPRMKDVWQMQAMTPMRMAIIARHAGVSLLAA